MRQTGSSLTTAITGIEIVAGTTHFVYSDGNRVRGDADGVIYSATSTALETVLRDPAKLSTFAYTGAIGVFADAATLHTSGLESDTTIYVRGIGPARITSLLNTRSSGGLVLEPRTQRCANLRLAGTSTPTV